MLFPCGFRNGFGIFFKKKKVKEGEKEEAFQIPSWWGLLQHFHCTLCERIIVKGRETGRERKITNKIIKNKNYLGGSPQSLQ